MNKVFNKIKTHPILILLVLAFVFLFPAAFSKTAQVDATTIVTGMGIDKKDNQIELTLQIVNAKSDVVSNEKLDVVSEKGETFSDALFNISFKLGKEIGLEHCAIVVLGKDLAETENCKKIMDKLYRDEAMTLNTYIITTSKDAKNVLEKSAELNNASSGSIQNNLGFNEAYFNSSRSLTLGKFFNEFYSPTGISLMPVIEAVSSSQSSGSGESGSGGSGSDSSSSGGEATSGEESSGASQNQSEALIQNKNEVAVFKHGKKITTLQKEQYEAVNLLNTNSTKGLLTVEHVTMEPYLNDATVTLFVRNSQKRVKSKIVNDKLLMNFDISLFAEINSILQDDKNLKVEEGYTDLLKDNLVEKIKGKLNEIVQTSLVNSKQTGIDFFNIEDRFYKFNNKALKKWKAEHNGESIIEHAEIVVNTTVFDYK